MKFRKKVRADRFGTYCKQYAMNQSLFRTYQLLVVFLEKWLANPLRTDGKIVWYELLNKINLSNSALEHSLLKPNHRFLCHKTVRSFSVFMFSRRLQTFLQIMLSLLINLLKQGTSPVKDLCTILKNFGFVPC